MDCDCNCDCDCDCDCNCDCCDDDGALSFIVVFESASIKSSVVGSFGVGFVAVSLDDAKLVVDGVLEDASFEADAEGLSMRVVPGVGLALIVAVAFVLVLGGIFGVGGC